MTPVGFSTGTLALGNFRLGIQLLMGKPVAAIELSALRDSELSSLIDSLDELDLNQFSYVSVHAPSSLTTLSEQELAIRLGPVFQRRWPVVLHPDVIADYRLWQAHGNLVCIENMDKRKPIGRTAAELDAVFANLPDASLCFDLGHARQIDPTMGEAIAILRRHGHRLKQLHVSEVNTASRHEPLSFAAETAFSRVAPLIPKHVPIIMETPVTSDWVEHEIEQALRALCRTTK